MVLCLSLAGLSSDIPRGVEVLMQRLCVLFLHTLQDVRPYFQRHLGCEILFRDDTIGRSADEDELFASAGKVVSKEKQLSTGCM